MRTETSLVSCIKPADRDKQKTAVNDSFKPELRSNGLETRWPSLRAHQQYRDRPNTTQTTIDTVGSVGQLYWSHTGSKVL
jgi:hypothetical protein